MNKFVALTIVGVVLLGMSLVAYNEYITELNPAEATNTIDSKPQNNTQKINKDTLTELAPPKVQTPVDTANKSASHLTSPKALEQVEDITESAKADTAATLTNPTIPDVPATSAAPANPVKPDVSTASVTSNIPDTSTKPENKLPEPSAKAETAATSTEKDTKKIDNVPDTAKVETSQAESKPATKDEKQPSSAKQESAEQAKVINKISIMSVGDGVTVRIDSSQMPAYKSMQLKNPPRIVLDLTGNWKVKAPGVPKNEFVSNVRLGHQKDGTRIVIDLQKAPASVRFLKYEDSGLDVRIR